MHCFSDLQGNILIIIKGNLIITNSNYYFMSVSNYIGSNINMTIHVWYRKTNWY